MGFGCNGITFSNLAASLLTDAVRGMRDPDAYLNALPKDSSRGYIAFSVSSIRGGRLQHMFKPRIAQTLRLAIVATASIAASHLANAGEGIWKAVVPPAGTMKGEFENNDPIGLYAGVKIKADCSLNWINPDDRKLYCFASATSLVFFLDAPASYLDKARKSWRKLNSVSG